MQKIIIIFFLFIFNNISNAQALDDITTRSILKERRVLPYAPIREADIFWEKRIWRIIDTREKMNKNFVYPENSFFDILANAGKEEKITFYSTEDDKFKHPLAQDEIKDILSSTDTITHIDPVTFEEITTIVHNDINWEDIKRFRVKEVWYFDSSTASLKVRILGIAPLIEVYEDNITRDFRYERPLFWVYYPELRNELARHEVFNEANDATTISWEDLMEMRHFSSLIYKESNIHDRRIQSYASGVDMLLEAEMIKQEIFNFEHDLWSY